MVGGGCGTFRAWRTIPQGFGDKLGASRMFDEAKQKQGTVGQEVRDFLGRLAGRVVQRRVIPRALSCNLASVELEDGD